MSKDRYAITCNGRAAFYACMWNDIRQCAMDNGWAVALHGSLNSDMDIMAMPWVNEACTFNDLVQKISKLFKDNELSKQYDISYNEKPHKRVVATIPIFTDFYLDISTIAVDINPSTIVEDNRECKGCCHDGLCGYFSELNKFDTSTPEGERKAFEEFCVGCCCGEGIECNRDHGCDNYETEPFIG